MFNTGNTSLILEEIYSRVSQESILEYYLGIKQIPCMINSPFRKDKNPSLAIFYYHNDIFWKDYGTSDKGTLIALLSKYYNLSIDSIKNRIVFDLIACNRPLNKSINILKKTVIKTYNSSPSTIKVKRREWMDYDLEYWNKYGINKKWLDWCEVYPISTIFFYYYEKELIIPAEKYAYVYIERKDNNITHKIYQPYSEKYKWRNENKKDVWELWDKIPYTGEQLIITSSRKDAMCIMCNTLIPSIALQSEGILPKKHVIEQLKKRYKKIYCLFDTDNAGREFGNRFFNEFNIQQIEIPEVYNTKDTSDFYVKYGKENTIKIINKLIQC